jgi:hypothetical protein
MRIFFDRFVRAARLDVELYKEVAADPLTLNQAWITVLIYCMAASWGGFGGVGAVGTNIAMITTLIGWYIWVFFTYFAAARLFRETRTEIGRMDRKTVTRAMGFASAPGVVRLLGMIPGLGPVALAGATVWMIVASTIAVKQALNFESTYRAAAACIIGWIISAFVQILLYVILFQAFGISGKPG